MELVLFLCAVVIGGPLLAGNSFPGSFWAGVLVISLFLSLIFIVGGG